MGFFYCVLYLLILSLIVFLTGRFYPREWINEDKFPFTSFPFEKNGKIYEKLGVKKWKTVYPDASMILHKFLPKYYPTKRLEELQKNKVPVLIKESCVAESTHVVAAILGFLCMAIWKRAGGFFMSVLYFLINVPAVIIQRYNRPRLQRIYKTMI